MLPDGKALKRTGIRTKRSYKGIKKNSIFIDCSSIDYSTTVKVHEEFKKKESIFF